MIDDPEDSTTLSKRFNTLQWLPGDTIIGIDSEIEQPTGETTPYPILLPARQASELYWLPKNIAIVKASIKTEAFDYNFNVPIFPLGPRDVGSSGRIAEMAHQLIFGIGAKVKDKKRSLVGGLDYDFTVELKLYPESIMSKHVTGTAVWWHLEASISAIPLSTAPKGYGQSNLPEDGLGLENVGAAQFNWINDTATGRHAAIGLYRHTPILYSDFTQCQCHIEFDYVPWGFEN